MDPLDEENVEEREEVENGEDNQQDRVERNDLERHDRDANELFPENYFTPETRREAFKTYNRLKNVEDPVQLLEQIKELEHVKYRCKVDTLRYLERRKSNNPVKVFGARKSVSEKPKLSPIKRREKSGFGFQWGQGTSVGQQGFSGQMCVNLVQQAPLTPFEGLPGEDARLFADKYEKLTVQLSNRARVDGFGAYLRGGPADWFTVLEKDKKDILEFDEDGIQSNAWFEIDWEEIRDLFEERFGEKKAKEILKCNQKSSETGVTYFYRVVKLHKQSELDLDQEQLATLIIQRMTDPYLSKFQHKDYSSLEKLLQDIKEFDSKRAKDLAEKAKEKRKATIALLEKEADDHEKKVKLSPDEKATDSNVLSLTTRLDAIQKQFDDLRSSAYRNKTGSSGNYGNRERNYSRNSRENFNRNNFRNDNRERYRGNAKRNEGGETRSRELITCFKCGKLGHHYARDCRTRPNSNKNKEFERRDNKAIEYKPKEESLSGNSRRQEN